MLYNIQRGYKGVTQRDATKIVYLVTTLDEVIKSGRDYVFTDGHAYHNFSRFFNDTTHLDQVDWKTVGLKKWHDTEEDPDRKRRKQAEFLIQSDLPWSHIVGIVVYNDQANSLVLSKLAAAKVRCKVAILPDLYY